MMTHLTKTFAVFGVMASLAMFLNIASFIQEQNSQSHETHVVSAFAG